MKLVDDAEAQRTLEELLDASKPPVPEPCRHLNYLFFTPFRYPARRPTRFRRQGDPRGVFYAAESVETAAAEMAFYKTLFFLESPETDPPASPFELTAFSALISTQSCLDTDREFDAAFLEQILDPVDYVASTELAETARDRGCETLRYRSVRAPQGFNVALLSCASFGEASPRDRQGWWFTIRSERIFARQRFGSRELDFPYTAFANDPRIASLL